jgi:hypothetical protein
MYNVSNVKQTLIHDTRAYTYDIITEKCGSGIFYIDDLHKSRSINSVVNVINVEVWLKANQKVK